MKILLGIGSDESGPAWTDCENIYVSPWWWLIMPKGERNFILEHERAHCQGEPVSEEKADEIAIQAHLRAGGNIQDAISALSRFPHTEQRIELMSQLYLGNYGNSPVPGLGFQPSQSDPETGGGWSAENWLDVLKLSLGSAPAIIDAAQNDRSGYGPGYYSQPQNQGISGTALLIGGVVILLAIVAFSFLKK